MTSTKEKFSNLIKEQNLEIFGGPFVVKNFLKNVEDYLNWNTLNDAINNNIVEWRLIEEEVAETLLPYKEIPWSVPLWSGIRQQNKQFILDNVNNGSTFLIERCCILNDNLKSLVSDIQEVFPVACDVQILGSKATNSKSFHSHSDRGNLFIIQAIGDTAWIVFKNRISSMLSYFYNKPEKEVLTPDLEVTLSPGDLLYIPPATYHVATPSIPRLSMSIPCTPLDAYVYLKNILPGFDQNIINQLCPDVNKYEF